MFDTLTNVDAYHLARGNTAWAAVTDSAVRTQYILRASEWLSRSVNWIGDRAVADQALAWPRKNAQYPDGSFISESEIPLAVKAATAMVADAYRSGLDLDGRRAAGSPVKRKRIDVIETEYDTRLGTNKAVPTDALDLLFTAGLAYPPGEVLRV